MIGIDVRIGHETHHGAAHRGTVVYDVLDARSMLPIQEPAYRLDVTPPGRRADGVWVLRVHVEPNSGEA